MRYSLGNVTVNLNYILAISPYARHINFHKSCWRMFDMHVRRLLLYAALHIS